MDRRLPSVTPGVAHSVLGDSNVMLSMELHRDAVAFYSLARKAQQDSSSPSEMERYVRASIVAAFSSLEAQLNGAAQGHAAAHEDVLEPIVRDVLREEETAVDDHGRIVVKRRRMTLTTRICFFTAFLSGTELDRSGQLWKDLLSAIQLRDRCVHPKPPFPFTQDPADAAHVINTVSALEREISRLAGTTIMSWWVDVDEFLEHPELDPGDPYDSPLRWAASARSVEVVTETT